jgi:hypothetical protein
MPRVHILDNQEWVDDFAQLLVHFERRDGVPRIVAPNISDRAHDSFKGIAIYWKMPRCSFRLPLLKFTKDLLHAAEGPHRGRDSPPCSSSSPPMDQFEQKQIKNGRRPDQAQKITNYISIESP